MNSNSSNEKVSGSLSEKLLKAAEMQLHGKSHLDLTSREIAAAAGTQAAMINYYFQGKDALLTELIDAVSIEASKRLRQIERGIDKNNEDPTEELVRALVETTLPHASTVSVHFIELFRTNSSIRQLYFGHAKLRNWDILQRLEDIVQSLIDKGIYDKSINPPIAVWMLLSIVLGPIFINPIWKAYGEKTAKPEVEDWISAVIAAMKNTFLVKS